MYFYNNLHPIFLMMRSIIMVTFIFNMYVDNVSLRIAPPLLKNEKNDVRFKRNTLKDVKKLI